MAGDPSEVSIIKIETTSYIIKDSVARTHIANSTVHVTSSDKTNWNNAATNSHTHSNKTVLDGIASTDITAWNSAVTNSHTHSNKTLLDSYTQTETDLSDAVSKKHSHSNKTVLDGISSADVTAWNGAYTKPTTGIPATDLASAVQTSLGLADTAVQDSSYVHTDNNFTSTLKSKLDGIAAGAEVNVQADWSTTDSTSDAFIKNKPTIPTSLSQLTSDSSHRTVTDAQISAWNSGGFTDEIVLIDVSLKRYDTHRFRIASASV